MPKSTLRREQQEAVELATRQNGNVQSNDNAVGSSPIPRMEPPPPYDAPYRRSMSDSSSHDNTRYANRQDSGCMNIGPSKGCMNVNTYGETFKSSGCMNYDSPRGCMNYKSQNGCMNYMSHDGCLNYKVETGGGCLNYRSNRGGCLQFM